jgi:hypothetical protein
MHLKPFDKRNKKKTTPFLKSKDWLKSKKPRGKLE